MLQDLSRLIEDYTGIAPYDSKPIVGSSAYKHKAGTHLAAILKNPAAMSPYLLEPSATVRRIVFVRAAQGAKTGCMHKSVKDWPFMLERKCCNANTMFHGPKLMLQLETMGSVDILNHVSCHHELPTVGFAYHRISTLLHWRQILKMASGR